MRNVRSDTPVGDDSQSDNVENSRGNDASLTDEGEDFDGHGSRISEERDLGPQHLTGSSKLAPLEPRVDPEARSKGNITVWIYLALAVLVVAIGAFYASKIRAQPKESALKESKPGCENFLQLHSKYPNTDDMLWSTLIIGVDRALNRDPGEPSTFIFLYNSSSVGQSLLDDVTRITIDCFGSRGAIWRTSSDFNSAEIAQDYGIVLDRHREELKSRGVLVVRDLDRVPPTAAKIFFTICDSYEPLVRKAIIFFTIDISRQQAIEQDRSATAIAERILKDLWRQELKPNMLDPLVVRLTENVFRID